MVKVMNHDTQTTYDTIQYVKLQDSAQVKQMPKQ